MWLSLVWFGPQVPTLSISSNTTRKEGDWSFCWVMLLLLLLSLHPRLRFCLVYRCQSVRKEWELDLDISRAQLS